MCITCCYVFYNRLSALKRRKSWRELEGVQKFKKGNNTVNLWHFMDMVSFLPYIEFLTHIPATSLKNFTSFRKWAESSIFRIRDYCINVEITIDDNIQKQWPMNYHFCQRLRIINLKWIVILLHILKLGSS